MVVQVKLYALLRLKHKDYDSKKGISITTENRISILDLFNIIDINLEEVSVVFVNNKATKKFGYSLSDGDTVKIFSHFPAGG
jgi:molybdopterin converting factor small subunit